ncbi:hypothetical protein RAM80_01605 [Pseudomonas sp. App30]|uniref:hypothetical protein n=1 Tax=Pseudomonas sp. App30 TaxID=3068990 RepID=UPI003A806C13
MFDGLGWCTVVAMSNPMPMSSTALTVSIAATLVAFAGFVVAYFQMKIASAKVKLDLYNRRWGIYLAALDYYQSAYDKTEESMEVKAMGFIKAFRESVFLFDSKDGITKTLEKIKDKGAIVLARRQAAEDKNWPMSYDKKAMSILTEKSADALTGFEADLLSLEQQMAKYINFRAVEGWAFMSRCKVKSA